ncbi:facilitated trehalose transporter Tret1-like [Diachasma alloeum]|uniref:facilitated trehalose transporter Tret1-like n=1 Tax=Diachasma alloeum TaxID=454923 RepID=UPI0010FB00F7|nr:facilitated trehalose transporter Tret1-like [Diachasma alloeum]
MTIFLVPIYVAEIASDDVRGKLGSVLPFALSVGILLAFILGDAMSYQMFAVCGMILPIAFVSGFVFMPETPIYPLRKRGIEAATRSLRWLRHNDEATVERELASLKIFIEEDSRSVKSVSNGNSIVNLPALLVGLSYGWTSTMIPDLQVEKTSVLTEPITEDQASWLVAALGFGPLLVIPFCGSFCERYGRKITGLVGAVPYIACWLFILVANNFYHILVAQALNGMANAMSIFFAPIYVAESVSDSIRGQLGSLFVLNLKIGIVCGYILGTVLSYTMFAVCGLIIPILYVTGLLVLPETPVYLVRKQRIDEAIRSLMWFRGNDKSAVNIELSKLQEFHNQKTERESLNTKDLLRSRGFIKGFVTALTVILCQPACGMSPLLSYTVTIFVMAKSSVDPNLATIVVGVMQVIGVGIATLTTERAGRRPLLMVSAAGVALCNFILGVFLLIQTWDYDVSAFSWIPLVSLSVFGVVYSIGMGAIPFIVATEVYHPHLASTCHTIILFIMFLCTGLIMKVFPLLVNEIGLDKCFFMFVIPCMYVFFFTWFVIPETKGKSKKTILEELNGVRGKSCEEINVKSVIV